MTKDEALKLALEALEVATTPLAKDRQEVLRARAAIKEALAQPEQEPVACQPRGLIDIGRIFTPEKEVEEPRPIAWKKKGAFNFCNQPPVDVEKWIPLYTTPPQPEQNQFNPDWDAMAVMVEEQQRMAKRIAELEAQQEPVAWITQGGKGWLRWHNKNDDHLNKTSVPLYKHPKRKPLSDAEIALISAECSLRTPSDIYFARAIEAAHGIKEKNNG